MQVPNLPMNFFIDICQNLIKSATDFNMKKKYKPRKNWITTGIMISTETKEKLFNQSF